MTYYTLSEEGRKYAPHFEKRIGEVNSTTYTAEVGTRIVVHTCGRPHVSRLEGCVHFDQGPIVWLGKYKHCPNCGEELPVFINKDYEEAHSKLQAKLTEYNR